MLFERSDRSAGRFKIFSGTEENLAISSEALTWTVRRCGFFLVKQKEKADSSNILCLMQKHQVYNSKRLSSLANEIKVAKEGCVVPLF